MTQFTTEQHRAYQRFIRARNSMGISQSRGTPKPVWVRQAGVLECVDVAGYNHPFYEPNDVFDEYLEASRLWWAIEPRYRDDERLRSTRGDYGKPDNWDEKKKIVGEVEQ